MRLAALVAAYAEKLQRCYLAYIMKQGTSFDVPCFMVGEGGFEPPKHDATDLQSAPFGHSGILPYEVVWWSWWTDSNPRPADYKP